MTSYYGNKRNRPRLMTITPEDVGDRVYVEVTIEPKTIQDEVALSQIAQAYRSPGADGRPLMSDEDINRLLFKRAHPERIRENVEMQMIAASDPEIMEIKRVAAVDAWKRQNKDLVKLAETPPDGEKLIPPMTEAEFKETVDKLLQLKMAEAQGQPVQQMLGQAMLAGQGMADPAQAAQLMPGVGGGLAQAALPEQFSMTPAESIPEPGAGGTQRKQTKRGKPQNNPKRPGRNY